MKPAPSQALMRFHQPSPLLWEALWRNHSSRSLVIGQGCWSWSKCVVSDQKPWGEAPFCTSSIYGRIVAFEEFGLWGLSWPGSQHHILGGSLWYLWNNATWNSDSHSNCKGKDPGGAALPPLCATAVSSTHSVFWEKKSEELGGINQWWRFINMKYLRKLAK